MTLIVAYTRIVICAKTKWTVFIATGKLWATKTVVPKAAGSVAIVTV